MRIIIYKIDDQRGASAVEFAIILPLLVLFLFGIIEFSILFYDKAVITNASREGARAGIVYDISRLDATEITAVVESYCQDRLITFGTPDLQTDIPTTCIDPGDELTVTVTYQYDFLLVPDIIVGFFVKPPEQPFTDPNNPISIIARTKMRCE